MRCWQRQGAKEGLVSVVNIALVNRFLADSRGKVAKSAEAQNPDTAGRYNGCVTGQDGLLNGGSLYLCSCILIQRTKQRQVERQGFVKRVEVADEPVVVIKSVPEKP